MASIPRDTIPAGQQVTFTGRDRGDLVIRLTAVAPPLPDPEPPIPIPRTLDHDDALIRHLVGHPELLRVSEASRERALLIVQGLGDACRRRGYVARPADEVTLEFVIGAESLGATISEETAKGLCVPADQGPEPPSTTGSASPPWRLVSLPVGSRPDIGDGDRREPTWATCSDGPWTAGCRSYCAGSRRGPRGAMRHGSSENASDPNAACCGRSPSPAPSEPTSSSSIETGSTSKPAPSPGHRHSLPTPPPLRRGPATCRLAKNVSRRSRGPSGSGPRRDGSTLMGDPAALQYAAPDDLPPAEVSKFMPKGMNAYHPPD